MIKGRTGDTGDWTKLEASCSENAKDILNLLLFYELINGAHFAESHQLNFQRTGAYSYEEQADEEDIFWFSGS